MPLIYPWTTSLLPDRFVEYKDWTFSQTGFEHEQLLHIIIISLFIYTDLMVQYKHRQVLVCVLLYIILKTCNWLMQTKILRLYLKSIWVYVPGAWKMHLNLLWPAMREEHNNKAQNWQISIWWNVWVTLFLASLHAYPNICRIKHCLYKRYYYYDVFFIRELQL